MAVKRSLLAALVALTAVAASADSANAFFGFFRGGGSGGSHGSWGSSGSHGSWGSHGSSGSWGSHGSHGSWGSHGSHGSHGSWGSHGSHGSWGSHGSYGGYGGGGYSDDGYYAGRSVVRERVYAARPSRAVIASTPAVKTRLTLKVPAEAKVTLAGVTTKQSGETRQFATTKLRAGQAWDDYKVVVELEQGGQIVREERVLKLMGGESQELSINFDSTQVAQR